MHQNYDFDRIYDRRHTNSVKWDALHEVFGSEDILPMWVADMDFPVAEPIINALVSRAKYEFFGYTLPGREVIEAVVDRMYRKFGWVIQPEWVVFTPGVIPALSLALKAFTHPGDGVLLQPPVYYPFFSVITANGCQIVENALHLVNGQYQMNIDDLVHKFMPDGGMALPPNKIRALLLCNPHNPIGRVWTRAELLQMGQTAMDHKAIVISDEIHCELLFKGHQHMPFASICEEFAQNSIVCMAPSKTFNLAGMHASSIIIPNRELRNDFSRAMRGTVLAPNVFGYAALEAAYKFGDDWLDQVLVYLEGNLDILLDFFEKLIPKMKVIKPQGTYLVWLDCRGLNMDDASLRRFMREEATLGLDDGFLFGTGGSGFQRMNIACPRPILVQALERLEIAVNTHMAKR